MKVVSTDALTKLIRLIKSSFISSSDVETATLVDLPTTATTLTAGLVKPDNSTITISSGTITTEGIKNQRSDGPIIKTWAGTRSQYDAITTKDSNTLYNITDDTDVSLTILEALYPVGAIYIGTMEVCPLTVLGIGNWAKVSEGRVLQGSDNGHNAGTTIEAGLPNITATGIAYEGSISPTGAVYKTSGGSCPSSTYQVRSTWNFDASLSNPIYGNSTTVQPSAFVVNIWKRTA